MEASKGIVVVHITDLHVEHDKSEALLRIPKLEPAILEVVDPNFVVIIALSGDIAYSGKAQQYAIVERELLLLKERLIGRGITKVLFVCSPGNHDCDFDCDKASLVSYLLKAAEQADPPWGQLLDLAGEMQSEFTAFAQRLCGSELKSINKAISKLTVEIENMNIDFLAINSAFSSQLNERPGQLRLPGYVLANYESDSDAVFALVHHPINWLNPADALGFSTWLDGTVDAVICGHEHRVDEVVMSRTRNGSVVEHLIGLPIHDKTARCGFRMLKITPTTFEEMRYDAIWESGIFRVKQVEGQFGSRNISRSRGSPQFSHNHSDFISDLGAGLRHPRVRTNLSLSDVYIDPDFREWTSSGSGSASEFSVTGATVADSVISKAGISVIFGQELSGKTSFAKQVMLKARSARLLPVYLNGKEIGGTPTSAKAAIRKAIESQYLEKYWDLIYQEGPDGLLIVVDDFHSVSRSQERFNDVLSVLQMRSSHILLMTNESPAFAIVEATARNESVDFFRNAFCYELLPLGHKRRGELIRKWVSYGRDPLDELEEIEAEVRRAKLVIDQLAGKASLPKFPFFFLALMQQIETTSEAKVVASNGSHGYLFEALITDSLDRSVKSHQMTTVHAVLSEFAKHLYDNESVMLSDSSFGDLMGEFSRRLIKVDQSSLLKELETARVLDCSSGYIRFRYPYLNYYYLARWLSDNCNVEPAASIITDLVNRVETEQSSNVFAFLAHFGREDVVLQKLIPFANSLFEGVSECQIESQSSLSTRFRTASQRAVLLDGKHADVSDEHHSRLDSIEQRPEYSDSDNSEDSLRFGAALRTIQVLGQILRSRAAMLTSDSKNEIALVEISLSRRLMTVLYKVVDDSADHIVLSATGILERKHKMPREKAIDIANQFIGAIVFGIARVCIIRVAEGFSSRELSPFVDSLSASSADSSDVQLFALVAKVLGSKSYPQEEVNRYLKGLSASNILPQGVLASATVRKFFVDPPPREMKLSVCSMLKINVKKLPAK